LEVIEMKNLILAFICLFLAVPSQAKIITVDDDGPADFNNIQAAIDDSHNGDEIIVFPGVYYENINFVGKNIILRSTQSATPNAVSSTIINGNILGTVVTFSGGETHNCVLSGFTITNGRASGGVGGGIHCRQGSSPTITNCTIAGNRATGSGGGIGCNGSPTINNCLITGNVAYWDAGGGISSCCSSATIINCTIIGNTARRGGGGIHCSVWSSARITNCTIIGNTAYKGAGIFCEGGSSTTIVNCTLAGNSAEQYGGGIDWAYSNLTLANCTFVGNSAPNGSAIGCGPCSSPPCILQLSNCILWDGGDEIWNNDTSTISIMYSDVQGGWPGEGNIDVDPHFVDSNNDDYHLKSEGWRLDAQRKVWTWDDVTSPCIDAGNPGSSLENELLTIPYDPDNEFGINLRINMGAYGGTPEASMAPYDWALLADLNNDGIINMKDFAAQAQYWSITGNQQPGDVTRDGIVDRKDLALLTGDWLEQTSSGISNIPPEVYITNPQDGATYYTLYGPPPIWYASGEIEACASDIDGLVRKVEFFVNESKIDEDNDGSDGWKTSWKLSAGHYTLTARGTDDDGATTTSPAVEIRVKEWYESPN
jgi:hypothetical protein